MPRGLRRRRPGTLYKKEPAILFPFRSKLVPANGLKQIRVDSLRFIHPAATGERFTDAGRKEEAVQKLQKAEAM